MADQHDPHDPAQTPRSTGDFSEPVQTSSRGGMVRGHSAIMKEDEGLPPGESASSTGLTVGQKIKGFCAQIHGAGEWFRGSCTAFLDGMIGTPDGKAKNEEIVRRGRWEMREKKFWRDAEDDRRRSSAGTAGTGGTGGSAGSAH